MREARKVAIARHPDDFQALLLDRLGERPYAEATGVAQAEDLVDDDDEEARTSSAVTFHAGSCHARRLPVPVVHASATACGRQAGRRGEAYSDHSWIVKYRCARIDR